MLCAKNLLIGVFLAIVAIAAGEEADCGNFEHTIAELQKSIVELKSSQCEPFSIVDPLISAYHATGDVFAHVYGLAQQHERMAKAFVVYEHSKKSLAQVADKVSSVGYTKHLQDLQSSQFYQGNLAPHVEKVSQALKPHMDEHVYPMLEKAKVQLGPHLQTAKDQAATAYKRSHDEVLPILKKASGQAKDAISQIPIDRAVAQVFDFLEKIAPKHAHALPKKTIDRVFLILVTLFVLFNLLCWCRTILHIVFLPLRIVFKVLLFAIRVGMKIFLFFPLKLFRTMFCICTCGACCRGKPKVADLKAKAKDSDGKKADRKDSKDSATTAVTVAELQSLLENCKKEKKNLDQAAAQIAKLVKNGKPMSAPKHLTGKTVTKDVFLKAVSKFKEIDAKKLAL